MQGVRPGRRLRWEAPTIVLAIAIYAGWVATTLLANSLPWALVVLAGGWLIAWQSSLQHEVIHGHPTRVRRINDAIGWPPLSLWLPYAIYRKSHLRHHDDERLTDPIEDPESAYFTPERWSRLPSLVRAILRFDATLLGRLTIGPAIMILDFLVSEVSRFARGDRRNVRIWLWHLAGAVVVLAWVVLVCGIPVWFYLAAFVYPGAALMRLRSFAEHRWALLPAHRTAVVERAGVFGLLFLNNNLHVLHHERPSVPWYDLPDTYLGERTGVADRNGGLVYRGYRDVALRFFLRGHDARVHPARRDGGQARAG